MCDVVYERAKGIAEFAVVEYSIVVFVDKEMD
jgi:hypothetical protein